ncbi:hypothetical protein ACJRO7_013631 [Eucalyptus globulus]|uniref:Disease resistance protein Roq1-like winged-helix domain-containing protein n=1 Tax=Eucalyptus globulus TaxID=34317 RepID=A0ABD3L864_EUCGL
MNLKDSLLLFSRYAFKGEQPPSELAALSSDIVTTTGGLPLALVIIGSFLKGKDQSIWIETRVKLRKVPHTDVQQKLRISYDSLEYEEQQMFLDIACFFIGINKIFATYLWEDLQYCPNSGLERMIELSLMKIDDNNELRMHDQLRDLGRAIACPANKKPWKCSRLWDEKTIIVQQSKEENKNIEALCLDEYGSNMFMKRWSFKRMPYLKFLRLSKVNFVGDFEDSLSELRWLEWEECPNSFKAINVHLEKLVMLDLSDGNISECWGGWSSIKMERLKVLNLFNCLHLKRTPNLSTLKSLEILILEKCHNLEEIDSSIGDVKCLVSLNLSDCGDLRELPSQLGNLRNLVSLNLSTCQQLQELLKEISQLKELKELIIDEVCIKEIPPWISSLKKLEILSAQACDSLVGLPDSISHLVNLLTLDSRFCSNFEGFPGSIGSLVKLQYLLLGNECLPPKEDDDLETHWYWDYNYCLNHIPHSIGKLELLTELHLTCAKKFRNYLNPSGT